jgi:hypothetical protein
MHALYTRRCVRTCECRVLLHLAGAVTFTLFTYTDTVPEEQKPTQFINTAPPQVVVTRREIGAAESAHHQAREWQRGREEEDTGGGSDSEGGGSPGSW